MDDGNKDYTMGVYVPEELYKDERLTVKQLRFLLAFFKHDPLSEVSCAASSFIHAERILDFTPAQGRGITNSLVKLGWVVRLEDETGKYFQLRIPDIDNVKNKNVINFNRWRNQNG